MPEIDDVNDMVWELRDEVRELREEVKRIGKAYTNLHIAFVRYAQVVPTGAHAAREVALALLRDE